MPNIWVEIAKISLIDPFVPDIPRLFYLTYPMNQSNASDIFGNLLASNFEVPDLDIKLKVYLEFYLQ
jgi:hypothetical protein